MASAGVFVNALKGVSYMATGRKDTADNSGEVKEVMTDRELNRAGQEPGQAIVPVHFNREQLGAIDSFDAAIALATAEFGDIVLADAEVGDGFKVATDSDKRTTLSGSPLLLLDWSFRESETGEWVLIHAVQRSDDGGVTKWVITDGSTGLCRELKEYEEKTGREGGMLVRNGLRVSDYYIDPETGTGLTKGQVREYMIAKKKMVEASTVYLDTSA